MKKVFRNVLLIVVVSLFTFNSSQAYDFEVDGIYYDIVSASDFTCSVSNLVYTGKLVIPAKVTYKTKELTVIAINDDSSFNSGLTSITIPYTISALSDGLFQNCVNLKEVIIEDGETGLWLGKYNTTSYDLNGLFYVCPIKSLYIGRNLVYPELCERKHYNGNYVYSTPFNKFENDSDLISIEFGNCVTYVAENLFKGCSNIKNIIFGENLKDIGNSAFEKCTSLYDVVIPDAVTSIDSNAFAGCVNLSKLTLGSSMVDISSAFDGCHRIIELNSLNSTPPIMSIDFSNVVYINATLNVPIGAKDEYQKDDYWKNFWFINEIDFSGIENISYFNVTEVARYDIHGRLLSKPIMGINIVKYSDGTTIKELVR